MTDKDKEIARLKDEAARHLCQMFNISEGVSATVVRFVDCIVAAAALESGKNSKT